jgi:hypothetical protein
LSDTSSEKWWTKLVILGIFIGIVAITAKVDWGAENPGLGPGFMIGWLFGGLLTLGIVLPILFMHLAGNETREREESDKKWFIIALIIYTVANGIPVVFYVILGNPPGFFLFLQLGLFGLIPAFILQPKGIKMRYIVLVILFAAVLAPLAVLVFLTDPAVEQFLYYLFFWGLFCVFLYLFIAIGWKLGGGTRRQSWNIFMAGMLVQFSTLEDFLYYLLNGQSLPPNWYWLEDFVINLVKLFGHDPTSLDLLIFCVIMMSIAVLILFDVHGYLWDRYIKKK